MEKLFQDSFLKNWNWAYLSINSLKFYTVCFYCISIWGLSKYIETKVQNTCLYLIENFIKTIRRDLKLIFCMIFWRKLFLLLYSINSPNSIVCLPLHREILDNMCIAVVSYPGCDVIYFEINFTFLIKSFFLQYQKGKTKI